MKSQHIVVLSGGGMSAESGLRTFRDHNGLWEDHRVEDVATPEAWCRDRALVLRFYNERCKALLSVEPNDGHHTIAGWEKHHRVTIITQNVDDLHERAGSTDVIHLHGELRKARSTVNPDLVYPMKGWELKEGDLCEQGSELRPHVVWFGEEVPLMALPQDVVAAAEVLVVVGTSLQVYSRRRPGLLRPSRGALHLRRPESPGSRRFPDFRRERVGGVGQSDARSFGSGEY